MLKHNSHFKETGKLPKSKWKPCNTLLKKD